RGDRRSRRGRSLDRSGQRSRRCGADAGGGARGGRCLRRRASCRAAVPQARARPRRSRGAGAARTVAERTRMSEPENFIARWSRRRREGAKAPEEKTPPAPPDAGAERAHQSEDKSAPAQGRSGAPGSPEAAFDPKNLPPIKTIPAESDITAFLAPGVPP